MAKEKYISPIYYGCNDVMQLLGVSDRKAYEVIHDLNQQLKSRGFITVAGRIPKKYFQEKFYCDLDEIHVLLDDKAIF